MDKGIKMEKILFLAHTEEDGNLQKLAKETLTVAGEITKLLKGNLTVGLLGKDIEKAASEIGACQAVKYFGVSGEDFKASRYSSDGLALEAIIKKADPTIVIAPHTSRFNRVLPGVAFRVNGRIDTHVSSFEISDETLKIQRWYYRQRILATLSRKVRPWFLVFDSGISEVFNKTGSVPVVEKLKVVLTDDVKRTEVTGTEAATKGTTTIKPDAKVLFVAGAGWSKKQPDGKVHVKDAEETILNFLDLAKASLGSSKSLVDQCGEGQEVLAFLTHMNQVGQTGSTPRHPKGLSTCCHGEEPHAVGWRFINERRAINLDPNCGWAHGKADVLYVADAFEVMRKVNELLSDKEDGQKKETVAELV